jgi:hypothetical protein
MRKAFILPPVPFFFGSIVAKKKAEAHLSLEPKALVSDESLFDCKNSNIPERVFQVFFILFWF